MEEQLILVDEKDNEIGYLDKLSVHKEGLLHRAFSVFIFNSKDELLLQQRADVKYHSAGLWTNTCCSHPVFGEDISQTINRRMQEEMGLECNVDFKFRFIYQTPFDNGLIEHELDYVYFGRCDDIPMANPKEVKDWKYMNLEKLEEEILNHPHKYSSWLKICLDEIMKHFETKSNA